VLASSVLISVPAAGAKCARCGLEPSSTKATFGQPGSGCRSEPLCLLFELKLTFVQRLEADLTASSGAGTTHRRLRRSRWKAFYLKPSEPLKTADVLSRRYKRSGCKLGCWRAVVSTRTANATSMAR
jgi:hypothetical protein